MNLKGSSPKTSDLDIECQPQNLLKSVKQMAYIGFFSDHKEYMHDKMINSVLLCNREHLYRSDTSKFETIDVLNKSTSKRDCKEALMQCSLSLAPSQWRNGTRAIERACAQYLC